jgi:hypothetical protein
VETVRGVWRGHDRSHARPNENSDIFASHMDRNVVHQADAVLVRVLLILPGGIKKRTKRLVEIADQTIRIHDKFTSCRHRESNAEATASLCQTTW